jgi:tetratricopeptide repeat protein
VNRTITCITVALVASAAIARADDAPSKAQLEAAKKAFAEAKALYDAGNRVEAIEKLKESYRLSHNAILLYNIGHAYDQLGQKDKALAFYNKFLATAPANAAMVDDAKKRVAELEKQHVEADVSATTDEGTTPTTPTTPTKPGTPGAGFHHTPVEAVPPNQPIDITASVPHDSGYTVTLFYRGQNDTTFTSLPLEAKGRDLVARIPGEKVTGTTLQYYLEVRDKANALVTRSGKSTSPNLVNIDPNLHGDAGLSGEGFEKHDVENPLGTLPPRQDNGVHETARFGTAKWVSTGVAGAMIGTAVVMFFVARQHSNTLITDSTSCGTPPCRPFDTSYDSGVESDGLRDNTIYQVTLGVGIATAAVAGYFWYRNATSKHTTQGVAIVPAIGDGFAGATAAARF